MTTPADKPTPSAPTEPTLEQFLDPSWNALTADPTPPPPAATAADGQPAPAPVAAPDAAPADAAPAESAPAPAETSAPPATGDEPADPDLPEPRDVSESEEATLAEKFMRAEADRLRLESLKGRQGQEIGDLRKKVSELETKLNARETPPAPALTKEEMTQLFLEDPEQFYTKVVDPKVQAAVERIVSTRDQQAEQEASQAQIAATPQAGYDLFLARVGMTRTQWEASPTAKAVAEVIQRDPVLVSALEGFAVRGDPRGFAEGLTRAYKAHRAGVKGAQAKARQAAETARVVAGTPSTAARPNTPVIAPPAPKSLYDKGWSDNDLAGFLEGAENPVGG